MSILEVNNVSKSFGGVKANVDISMSVKQGSIVGLIGPNGSGKKKRKEKEKDFHLMNEGLLFIDKKYV